MITGQLLIDEAQKIDGWMSIGELSFLAKKSSELKPNSTIFEIGSFCGRSARALADNSPNDCKIYCIDCWDCLINFNNGVAIRVNETVFDIFCINLSSHILTGKILPIIRKYQDYSPNEKADFIFIDGNHEYDYVMHDIRKSLNYIKDDGIIAGHDYQFDSVKLAVNSFFKKDEIRVEETIWWIQKS